MIFETKFNPGEEVWFMHYNKPQKFTIEKVKCSASTSFRYVNVYEMRYNSTSPLIKHENELFRTKQELIESL